MFTALAFQASMALYRGCLFHGTGYTSMANKKDLIRFECQAFQHCKHCFMLSDMSFALLSFGSALSGAGICESLCLLLFAGRRCTLVFWSSFFRLFIIMTWRT